MSFCKILLSCLSFFSICTEPIFITSKEHLLSLIKQQIPSCNVIAEAGASNGHDTVMLASHFQKAKIFSFEPVAESFGVLQKRIVPFSNVTIFNCALGNITGQTIMYLSRIPNKEKGLGRSSSSLLQPYQHDKYSKSGKVFDEIKTVPIITLDDWGKQYGIDAIDFIWLDTQGTELQILKAAPLLLSKLQAIYLEVEFVEAYKGQNLFNETKMFLEKNGFVWHAADFSKQEAGKLVYEKEDRWFGNALFIRSHS